MDVSRETSAPGGDAALAAEVRHRKVHFLVCQAVQLLGRLALRERSGSERLLDQDRTVILDGLFEVLETLNDEDYEEALWRVDE